MPVILLYCFDAQQQTSSFRCQKFDQLVTRTSNVVLIRLKRQSLVQKITSYADIVSLEIKRVVIFSDSKVKRLKMKQFSSHIQGCKVYLKDFICAKADQLNHHVKPSFKDYKCDTASKGKNEIIDIPPPKENYGYSRYLSKS